MVAVTYILQGRKKLDGDWVSLMAGDEIFAPTDKAVKSWAFLRLVKTTIKTTEEIIKEWEGQ